MVITFISHACVLLEDENVSVVIDPFVKDPNEVKKHFPSFVNPDFIVVTHGHSDHMGSLFDILGNKTKVIGIVELCSYLRQKGVKNAVGMNFGGSYEEKGFTFSPVRALHTSANNGVYLGEPSGFIIKNGDVTVYHMGDTDVFGDMELINELYNPNVVFVPIGGRYTMDEKRAAFCMNRYFPDAIAVPIHYGTFPEIEVSGEGFNSLCKTKKKWLNKLNGFEII